MRNSSHPILQPILKYRKHPSILAVKNKNYWQRFNICRVSVEEVVKEIKKLSLKKAAQSSDIPVEISILFRVIRACFLTNVLIKVTFHLF